jgi:Flp pilus assembly protein CpaB
MGAQQAPGFVEINSMAAYSSTRRKNSPVLVVALTLMLIVVGAAATVATLAALGLVDLPFLRSREPSRVGMVKVALSARLIPAYKLIRRDDLIDPATGTWIESWVSEKDIVPHKIVADPTKIIGRVMTYDKGPLFSFTENDFMPVGTRAGLVAGIPPGKRSLTLPTAKLDGIYGLQMGDRFDIVSTLPVDKNRTSAQRNVRGLDGMPPPEPRVRVLVENGAVVTPVHVRDGLSTSQSLTKGSRSSMKPVEEVVIALEPEEIPGLTAAMSQNAAILVVARSGHPDDAKIDSVTPDSNPPPPPTIIETVVGDKRETVVFPQMTSEEEPVARPQRPASPRTIPHGKPQSLPVGNLVEATEETAFAPAEPGARISP